MISETPFPLSEAFPSTTAINLARNILKTADETARDLRGDFYDSNKPRTVWHSPQELAFYYELAAGMYQPRDTEGYILQCGCWCGGSACAFAGGLRDHPSPFSPAIAIDHFGHMKHGLDLRQMKEMPFLETRRTQYKLGLKRHLTLVVSYDVEYLEAFWKRPIRVGFIDSSHAEKHTLDEIRAIEPWVVKNGFLAFHDYYVDSLNVKNAVNTYFSKLDRDFEAYNFQSTTFIIHFRE